MATIKSTIKLESSDLLTSQVALTTISNETIGLDAAFTSAMIPVDGHATIYGPTTGAVGTSKTVYIYVKALSTNNSYVRVIVNDGENTSLVMQIAPGDFTWFPLAVFASGVEVTLYNNSQTAEAGVEFLFAEKG
jgi:hypothetical protein